MQALRTLLRNMLSLARHALYAAAVKRWPELRQQGRSVKLSELPGLMQAQRERRSATQRASAEECGIHTSLYGRLERGEDVNTIEVLTKLCKWLGINPGDIDFATTCEPVVEREPTEPLEPDWLACHKPPCADPGHCLFVGSCVKGGTENENDTPTPRRAGVVVTDCDGGPLQPSGVQREPGTAGPDRGSDAAEQ